SRRTLQRTMTEKVGIVRSNASLKAAAETRVQLLREYEELPEAPYSPYSLETLNLLQAAAYVIEGAINRPDNVGLHFNVDLANRNGPSPVSLESGVASPST
ncbi:MAG: hypothetical protein SNJ76_06420, partial [Fimbriimonadaceae bacterium]